MQLTGNANTTQPAEVEAHTLALRMTPRPEDYGQASVSGGFYALAAASGTMTAGLAANSPIFSARYTGSNLALLKKLLISAGDTSTAFTAGLVLFQGFIARSFSASDTGGTSVTVGTGGNKLRTANMGTFGIGDYRIANTGTLTAGTRTLDAQPFCSLSTSVPATAGAPFFSGGYATMFEARPGEYPLVCANNEGFVIQATVPATGTWQFSIQAVWLEIASSVWY